MISGKSLVRLKTDYFDVYQLHCLKRVEEVEEALGPGGAMETVLEAKKEGKVVWYSALSLPDPDQGV